jgi:tagatose-1,6-bisphosphate aldolase non-catalytic subunit AgaZ/GatZ
MIISTTSNRQSDLLMTLPTYSAISFRSQEEHQAALYDACLLIVNTYNQTDMLDGYNHGGVTAYDFMKFARSVLNQISNIQQGN